ncbi:MAG: hypothetical protein IPG70_07720 [Moraxellaceae bacterium]|jgi:hypothetical protein|nr:hypothetical protein [Moraxellaceae bacterium]
MPTVNVKLKYSSTGGAPTATTSVSVYVISAKPTESEVSAAIKVKHPQWNFIILEIR